MNDDDLIRIEYKLREKSWVTVSRRTYNNVVDYFINNNNNMTSTISRELGVKEVCVSVIIDDYLNGLVIGFKD